MVQGLRTLLAMQGTWVWSLVRELRSHMLQGNWALEQQLQGSVLWTLRVTTRVCEWQWRSHMLQLSESEKVKVKSLSRVRLLVTPRTAAYQAPPSMGFSRWEYWNGLPLPSPTTKLHSSKQYGTGKNKQTNTNMNQCNRTESPEINLHTCGH